MELEAERLGEPIVEAGHHAEHPVKPEHYIIKGKSPDWNKAHACINHKSFYTNPCDALLCFTGKGQW
jgi:hypothetical protein